MWTSLPLPPLSWMVICWLVTEGIFLIVFYGVWLPRFQKLRPPEEYRDYARDRRKLLIRILQRLETNCRATNTPILPTIQAYIREWFHPVDCINSKSGLHHRHTNTNTNTNTKVGQDVGGYVQLSSPSSTQSASTLPSSTTKTDFWPKRGDMDHFFAWAFFGKFVNELEPWMNKDMQRMYETIEFHYGLTFEEGITPDYRPMRLTLDPLESSYRPFFIYVLFSIIRIMAGFLLRSVGFYAGKTTSGLMYFYRPARKVVGTSRQQRRLDHNHHHHHQVATTTNPSELEVSLGSSETPSSPNVAATVGSSNSIKPMLPLIFLHGIAPGGLAFYLPMLLFLGNDGRPLLFFENPDISFFLWGGDPPNERDTVNGVWEAVDKHLGSAQEVSIIGHSFGSCAVTWLVHSVENARIRQIVLVDPVSILLSEPDVIQNFLYQRKALKRRRMPIKIGVVSNEIFTEHYLRRHFAWYNSELWLEDVPDRTKVLVCLSAEDPIVPAQKVHREVMMRKPEVDMLLWENAGHAHCVTRPRTWRQMQVAMKRQELMIPEDDMTSPSSNLMSDTPKKEI
jgi:pimeloyl-ACP methyl ester carboxylesterase